MIRKIIRIEFEEIEFKEFGSESFPERFAWVYLEGSCNIPDYEISTRDLEKMAFGC